MSSFSPDLPQAHAAIDTAARDAQRRQPAVMALLCDLIRRETHQPSQCVAVAPLIERAMRENGFEVECHAPLDKSGQPFPIVLGWLGPRTKTPDVLLCAHVDTSPGGNGWTRDPFGAAIADGCIFGRGSVVSKSDIACFIHAAAAASRAASAGTVAVAVTSDEGSGGDHGAAYLLGGLDLRPGLAIFPGFTDVVTTAHNGCVQIKLKVVGTACHQSIVPKEEDAMRRASQICADIYALADELAASTGSAGETVKPTLNVTRMEGGTVFGMAPGEVEIWIDRRVTPAETIEAACAELTEALSSQQSWSATAVSSETVRLAEPMRPDRRQGQFAKILSEESAAVTGRALPTGVSTLYTDARWFSHAGIATVMFGAGESDITVSRANGGDERVPEHCLRDATAILARAIVRHLLERHPHDR